MAYRYDVFLSYWHANEWPRFVDNVFLPTFRHWLAAELGRQPAIFIDSAFDSDDILPDRLAAALEDSGVMVCLWSRGYFGSRLCVAELALMLARRSALTGPDGPPRLIFPVLIHGGDYRDHRLADIQQYDIRNYANPWLVADSPSAEGLSKALIKLAQSVGDAIAHVPDHDSIPQSLEVDDFLQLYDESFRSESLLNMGARYSLSPDSPLAYADALRNALGLDEVHMEHLIVGLSQQDDGAVRRMLDGAGVDTAGLAAALAVTGLPVPLPAVRPGPLTELPPVSEHVAEALDRAAELASHAGSPVVESEYLLGGVLSVPGSAAVEALARLGMLGPDSGSSYDRPRVRPQLLAGAAADTVPEPGDGRVRAADRLGTAAEVEMLVAVLLARDTPLPLALGLFGDWGSGKSFFIALMQERVSELAKLAAAGRPEASPFCAQVRQVRFNAWHYVDANLWASLAATLFDELARADAPDDTMAKLSELEQARRKVRQARTRSAHLEHQVRDLEAKSRAPAAAVAVSVSTAILAVRDKPLIEDLKKAGKGTAVGTDVVRFMNTLGDADSAAQTAVNTWRLFREEIAHRRRWLTWAVLALLVGVAVAASVYAELPAGFKLLTIVGGVAAGLVPALAGALQVMRLAREARQAYELPLIRKQEQLAQAQMEQERAEEALVERERELAELHDQGQKLREFVRERAASSDYRSQLGVISQVRRDFEQLVVLIPGTRPADAHQAAAIRAAIETKIPDVDRIVLYIDDLDRCPHEKVVEVLQAVHLLLAFKLFVVVVGVDSRWLERSLQAHYHDLLEEPASYLEKIFQIPFTLPPMTPSRYRSLIDGLTPSPASEPASQNRPDSTSPTRAISATPATDATPTSPDDTGQAAGIAPARQPPLPRPEALIISDDERDLLGQLGGIIQTPRTAKRLVNIYRILRVSVSEDELQKFRPGGGDEYQAVILLLAILIGLPAQTQNVFAKIMAADGNSDVWDILDGFDSLREPLAALRGIRATQIAAYHRWAPRVSRFSFRHAIAQPLS